MSGDRDMRAVLSTEMVRHAAGWDRAWVVHREEFDRWLVNHDMELLGSVRAQQQLALPDREKALADGINRAVDGGLGPHPLPESYCQAVAAGVDAVLSLLGQEGQR